VHLAEARVIASVVCVQNSYGVGAPGKEQEFLRVCGELGVACVPFFAIAGAGREAGARTAEDEAMLEVARARGVSTARVRLAWTSRQGPHVLAIPGTGDPARLVENVAAGATRLSDDEMARLRSPQQDLA
jgi:pyridoxine 4-dehydrogenase